MVFFFFQTNIKFGGKSYSAEQGGENSELLEFINNEALAKIVDEWELADYLIVGKSDYLNIENAVNTLKELAEHGVCSVPEYEYSNPDNLGYVQDGNPIWVCTCFVTNDKTGIVRQKS